MALTLEQYAAYLETSGHSWPPPPAVERPPARPHLAAVPHLRAVLFNVYGTLLAVAGGDLLFEHPDKFVMDLALERTIQEFKMWAAMSRKPGQPSEYMGQIYAQILLEQRTANGGERHPEVCAERVWEAILKRLLQKTYKFDTGFYGSLNEFSKKVAYYFHSCLQGVAAYPETAGSLRALADRGLLLGLAANGQCFTMLQLGRALADQDRNARPETLFTPGAVLFSHEVRARTPSERVYRPVMTALAERGLAPGEVLYVTSRLPALATARRLGMHTALFAGDKASFKGTPEQLKEPATRPDVLVTDLAQLVEIL